MGRAQARLNEGDNARKRVALGDRINELQTLAVERRTNHSAMLTLVNALKADLNILKQHVENGCFDNPGLAIGSDTTQIQNANAITFMIDGVLYSKAATDDLWDLGGSTATLTAVTAAKYACITLYLDASGVFTVAEDAGAGTAATLAAAKAGAAGFSATKAIIGYYTVGDGTNTHTWVSDSLALHSGAYINGPNLLMANHADVSETDIAAVVAAAPTLLSVYDAYH